MRMGLLIGGVAVVGVLLFPINTTCGVAGQTCASAPDAEGKISRYFEVQPLGATLVESVTKSNFPIKYVSGYDESES